MACITTLQLGLGDVVTHTTHTEFRFIEIDSIFSLPFHVNSAYPLPSSDYLKRTHRLFYPCDFFVIKNRFSRDFPAVKSEQVKGISQDSSSIRSSALNEWIGCLFLLLVHFKLGKSKPSSTKDEKGMEIATGNTS